VPSVSVLYLTDAVVSPHLELLRNICEPHSKSRPHVTVRYFHKLAIPIDHLRTRVSHIDVLEPGSFGFSGEQQENRTVYLRCQSDDLLQLEHKPLFPTSEFHITIYDGFDKGFAAELLRVLRKFKWGIRVNLPQTSELTAIQIKPKRRKSIQVVTPRQYRPAVENLFSEIFGRRLTWELALGLSSEQRLHFAQKICDHLQSEIKGFEKVSIPTPTRTTLLENDDYEVHLTPPELALSIARCALAFMDDPKKIDFGDPAAGTGAFFAALTQLVPRQHIQSAVGIEISPKQVEAARWRWEGRGMDVIQCDYLHMEKLPHRNFVLANPPYMRHQGIPIEYKQELRQRASALVGSKISGLSGQYVYFLLLSDSWMAENAVAAWLIPSEFMQTTYGSSLREYFTTKVSLLRIHQFGQHDPQFENAHVLPSVVIFKKTAPSPNRKVELTSGGTLHTPDTRDLVTIAQLHEMPKWFVPPRSTETIDSNAVQLGELFEVRRGIATGANNFFIIELSKAKELGIPKKALKPLLPKFRSLDSEVIERLEDGYPAVDPQLCVIDTEMNEKQISTQYPKMWKYLQDGVKSGLLAGHLIGKRKPWYKQEQRDPALFVCTYMGRASANQPGIHFLWNKSDAIATNTYLMLYPRPGLKKLLDEKPAYTAKVFALLKAATHKSVATSSRTHAGGLLKIEPSELRAVWLERVPNLVRKAIEPQLI
jgi:adenine-specific DNA-methyltransferase